MYQLPCIVTVNVLTPVFPDGSVDVYVTVVTPMLNESPGLWLDARVCKPESSVAVYGVQLTTAVAKPGSVLCVMSTGMLTIVGLSLSAT